MILEAVPGVGNVGKILIDAVVEKHPSRTIGWILHPDFPPCHLIRDGFDWTSKVGHQQDSPAGRGRAGDNNRNNATNDSIGSVRSGRGRARPC